MARYEITSPDGRRFEVNAPDDASEDQVLNYAQKQFSSMKPAEPKPATPSTGFDWERAKEGGMAAFKALSTANPVAFGVTKAGEGMTEFNKWLEKFAYGAGGKVTDIASEAGASPNVAAGLGFAANVGTQALPMVLGGLGAKAGQPAGEAAGKRLMQSAIKPTLADRVSGKGARAAETMLNQGVNVSPQGMVDVAKRANVIGGNIDDILGRSTETINKGAAAGRIQDVINKIPGRNPAPQDALAQAERYYTQVMSNPHLGNQIPVGAANELKKGIYKELGDMAYGQGQNLGATKDAMKAMARGIKEEIAAKFPEVAKLNAQEGELLNVLKVARDRALQAGNKDIGGIAWLYNNPAAGLAFFADRSSLFKSILARMFYKGGGLAGAAGGMAVGTGIAVQGEE